MRTTGLILGLMVFLTGCVTAQDHNRLQNRVERLYQIEKSNQDQISCLEDSITQLKNKTESIVSRQTDSVRSTQANLWSQFESQRVQLATIKGKQELFAKNLRQMTNTSTNNTTRLNKIEKQLSELNHNQQILISQLGVDVEKKQEKDTESQKKTEDLSQDQQEKTPKKLYEQALQSFNGRNYQRAIALWSDFVDNFPDNELVSNSYFWLGECHYQTKEYGQAILQYQKVIEEYPKSGKIPSAILKQGLCFYKLEKNKAGRVTLQRLIDEHPDSAAAKRAKIYLKNR